MIISKKAAVILLSSLLFLPITLSAQETEETEPVVYIDVMFVQYIELENRVLLDEIDLEQELYEIRKLKTEAEKANRRDLLSRLDMLDFVVSTKLEDGRRSSGAESILEKILTDEQRRLAKNEIENSGSALTAAALGTTIVSGMIFLGSSLIYEDFYSKFTATENTDQAAFYLFWWETCRTASVISGWSTAAAAVSSGILALLF